jgi:hypothetical protein
MKGLLFCMIILIFSNRTTAQFPFIQKFNYPDQLPTQVIYNMLSDKKGYIWIGTDKGLYRFNGRSFTKIPFSKTSVKSVSYLQQDAEGTIWCVNFYKEIFYVKNDTLRQFKITKPDILASSTLLSVSVTDSEVWVASLSHLFQFNKKTGILIRSTAPPQSGIVYLMKSNQEVYALGDYGWLFSYSSNNLLWKKTTYKNLGNIRMLGVGKDLLVAPVGTVRKAGFIIKDKSILPLHPIAIPASVYIYHFASTAENEHWVCTQSGAYLWDIKTGNTQLLFPDQSVTDIVKDYQGNYWVSTLDNGLFICPSLGNKMYKIRLVGTIDNITSLELLNNHHLITGSSKGQLAGFDVSSNTVFKYNMPVNREIEFIKYDSTTNLIFTNCGIIKEGQKNFFENFDYSKGVARDPFGNLIVSYFGGAYIVNDHYGERTGRMPKLSCKLYGQLQIKNYINIKNRLLLRNTRSNTVLASAGKEKFWVAYEDGLYEYSYHDSIRIIYNPAGKKIVTKTLFETDNGELIAGTTTEGIYVIKNGKVIRQFNKLNGLISNTIKHCIYFNNAIWALTDEGLELIDIKTGIISNITEEYGLEQLQVNDFAVNKDRFFLATSMGVLVNDFSDLRKRRLIIFPVLTATANGFLLKDSSVVPSTKNNFIFKVEALHFKSPTSLIYKYRTIGLDTTWKTTNYFASSITYNRMSPGKYIFQIQANDLNGYYNSKILSYTFQILPPVWLRWWFIAGVLAAVFGSVYYFLQWWSRRLLYQQTLKEQLFKSQLVALRSQMNPHFLYNVLNTVQGLLYDNRKTEAGTLLGNFSDLMRKTLKASDSQLQHLNEELENLRLYLELEKARFDKDFSYSIQTNLREDATLIFVPSLMLQPFVENAVKHGLLHKSGHKELSIQFDQLDEGLRVIIEDNGIGRKQSEMINTRNKNKPSSFATKAIDERIKLFNRLYKQKISYTITDKEDDWHQSLGTIITLIIPDYASAEAGT